MKKFLLAVLLSLILIPFSVNAEECTDEMVAIYLTQANNVYMQYETTSNPNTFKVYVYGLSTGISYDGINGTRYSDGYYAFASAGDIFSIVIKISDGSICALRNIKTLSITLPSSTTVTQPTVEETPITSNESSQATDTTTSNSSSSSESTSSSSSSSDTSSAKSEVQTKADNAVDITTEEVVDDSTSDVDLSEENTEDLVTATSEASKEKKSNNKVFIVSVFIVSILVLISMGIYIYIKKFRRHKK